MLWEFFNRNQVLIAILSALFTFLIHSYVVLSESDKEGIGAVFFFCWSLFPAVFFVLWGNFIKKFKSLKFALLLTAWIILFFMLLFAVFVLMATLQSDGLRESALIYYVPLMYPLYFGLQIFVGSFVLAVFYRFAVRFYRR